MMKQIKINHKSEGSSIYIWMPIIFIIMFLMLYLGLYSRSANIVSDNLKTSLDTATLAATTVDINGFLETNLLGFIGNVTDDVTITDKERSEVLKKYTIFQTALMENIGLDNEFNFKGGTCGWAGDFISSGPLKLDSFTIYEVINNHVYAYEINDIGAKNISPAITKSSCGNVGIAKTKEFISSDGRKITKEITQPIILAKVEFPANTGFLINSIYKLLYDEESVEGINNELIVSKYSITELKSNE